MVQGVREFQLDISSLAVGKLGVIEFDSLPFEPKRLYWLSEVPEGSERGHHAHKQLTQLMCVSSGSVDVDIYEGHKVTSFHLDSSSPALILNPGLWRELKNFQEETTVFVLCDAPYMEEDYIRDFQVYLDWFSEHHD
jgi:dTDP-4-dehydrorhamnose 3,5-epimerase-like enzyme